MRIKKYASHLKVRLTVRLWVLRFSVEFDMPRD